jgi:hypothetical protein
MHSAVEDQRVVLSAQERRHLALRVLHAWVSQPKNCLLLLGQLRLLRHLLDAPG